MGSPRECPSWCHSRGVHFHDEAAYYHTTGRLYPPGAEPLRRSIVVDGLIASIAGAAALTGHIAGTLAGLASRALRRRRR